MLLRTAGTRETNIMCLTGEQLYSRRCILVFPYLAALTLPFSAIYHVTVLTATMEQKMKLININKIFVSQIFVF
jgi:hypothetical protein